MQITARNTNALAPKVYPLLQEIGVPVQTRNGPALRFEDVVVVKMTQPCERVNFSPARDANPFFHLVEAMAMLCGYNSVALLAYFAKNMANYSDDGKTFNSFYGTRMHYQGQLWSVIDNLRVNPDSRQELVVLWDIEDLNKATKDKACNFAMLFEIFQGKLRMTTFNRSNDAIWGGVTGANIVHFSFFQEFVACALGIEVGAWSHVSANLHVYVGNPKLEVINIEAQNAQPFGASNDYPGYWPLDIAAETQSEHEPFGHRKFVNQLWNFCHYLEHLIEKGTPWDITNYEEFTFPFLTDVLLPMTCAWVEHKGGNYDTASDQVMNIGAPDWRIAAGDWITRHTKVTNA